MEKLVRESEYFIAWLVFWLCTVVGGFILGGVIGFFVGMILGLYGVDLNVIKVVCGISGFIIGVLLSYVLFRLFVGLLIVKKAKTRALEFIKGTQNKTSDSTT